MQAALIAGIGIGIVSVLFAIQNNTEVSVRFLAWSFDGSLALVLLLTLGLGALVAGLLSSPAVIRGQWTAARQGRRIAELEYRLDEQNRKNASLSSELTAAQAQGNEAAPLLLESVPEKPYVGLRTLLAQKDSAQQGHEAKNRG